MSQSTEKDLQIRTKIYEDLGNIAQSMSAPVRLKILQNLSNGPSSVEGLSLLINETIGNTSQHLQKMLRAGLLQCEKNGVSRTYSLTNNKILDLWFALQSLASDLSPHIKDGEEHLSPKELCSDLKLNEVINLVQNKKAILVDAREQKDAESTPVLGAINIPTNQINHKIKELSKSKIIFVFCRGRYCSLANPIVIALRKHGHKAYRLKETYYQITQAS